VILNAGALLSQSFYNMWVSAFFWIPVIDNSPTHGLIFAIGAIIGLILLIGSILMLLGYGTIGSIVVFPMAVLSLIIGGGFVAGFVLGVVGGILGMLGRYRANPVPVFVRSRFCFLFLFFVCVFDLIF